MSSTPHIELPRGRLIEVRFDSASIARHPNPDIEQERQVAIHDLIDCNSFELVDGSSGPYRLILGHVNTRLVFDVRNEHGEPLTTHTLSVAPLRRIVRDYFLLCESYYDAVKSAPSSRIEALDISRRGLHDEGSHKVVERLAEKIKVDHNTGRQLFTLICALHWKG